MHTEAFRRWLMQAQNPTEGQRRRAVEVLRQESSRAMDPWVCSTLPRHARAAMTRPAGAGAKSMACPGSAALPLVARSMRSAGRRWPDYAIASAGNMTGVPKVGEGPA